MSGRPRETLRPVDPPEATPDYGAIADYVRHVGPRPEPTPGPEDRDPLAGLRSGSVPHLPPDLDYEELADRIRARPWWRTTG